MEVEFVTVRAATPTQPCTHSHHINVDGIADVRVARMRPVRVFRPLPQYLRRLRKKIFCELVGDAALEVGNVNHDTSNVGVVDG